MTLTPPTHLTDEDIAEAKALIDGIIPHRRFGHSNTSASIGCTARHAKRLLSGLLATITSLQSDLQRSKDSHEHTKYWYGCRIERITALAKEKGIWPEVAAIIANGTVDAFEPPTYAQQFNMMVHRLAAAEAAEVKARSAAQKAESDLQRTREALQLVIDYREGKGEHDYSGLDEEDRACKAHDGWFKVEAVIRAALTPPRGRSTDSEGAA